MYTYIYMYVYIYVYLCVYICIHVCVCADSYWPGTSDTRFSCALSVVLVIATTCRQGSHKASSNTKEPLYNICIYIYIYRRRNTTFTRLFLNNEMSVSLTGFLTGSNSSGGVTGTIWPNAQADEASEDGFGGVGGQRGHWGSSRASCALVQAREVVEPHHGVVFPKVVFPTR